MDELLEQYERASTWTEAKVAGAVDKLDAATPCDSWDVRTLLNHTLDTQRYFVGAVRSEAVSLPAEPPPELAIAFSDQLLLGSDLASATAQDARMPEDLAEAAFHAIHGRFTDEQRKEIFKPELEVGPGASAQAKLLAYTGRSPVIIP